MSVRQPALEIVGGEIRSQQLFLRFYCVVFLAQALVFFRLHRTKWKEVAFVR